MVLLERLKNSTKPNQTSPNQANRFLFVFFFCLFLFLLLFLRSLKTIFLHFPAIFNPIQFNPFLFFFFIIQHYLTEMSMGSRKYITFWVKCIKWFLFWCYKWINKKTNPSSTICALAWVFRYGLNFCVCSFVCLLLHEPDSPIFFPALVPDITKYPWIYYSNVSMFKTKEKNHDNNSLVCVCVCLLAGVWSKQVM